MLPGYVSTKILILVKTYPNPSQKYEETVCTAGITEDGNWIRLYPLNFRRARRDQQFKKYQWVSVGLAPKGADGDSRPESRTPDTETLTLLNVLETQHDKNWTARRKLIDSLPQRTLKECEQIYAYNRTSLSVVVPQEIMDINVESNPVEPGDETIDFKQIDLFGHQSLPLTRLPYKFQYIFRCRDDDKPHRIMIEDWELGTLFLKMRRDHDEQTAIQKVKDKFLGELCSPNKDTRFFMGTHSRWGKWLVLGVFYPPTTNGVQTEMF